MVVSLTKDTFGKELSALVVREVSSSSICSDKLSSILVIGPIGDGTGVVSSSGISSSLSIGSKQKSG